MTVVEGESTTAVPDEPLPTRRSVRARRRGRPPRRRVSVIGVIGELLITAGVLVLLFIGWQQYLDNWVAGSESYSDSVKQSQEWDRAQAAKAPPAPDTIPVYSGTPANGERFAILIVPRFGADYYRHIAQGTGADVLNKYNLGHYTTTQMPGAIGNFAIASHRHAYGANLLDENKLQVGDHLFVETPDGWYQFSFRNLQYVQPTEVGVIDPVPEQSGLQPQERLLTLTTCNPLFSTRERMIAYNTFDKFYPRADGPPAEIAATVNGAA